MKTHPSLPDAPALALLVAVALRKHAPALATAPASAAAAAAPARAALLQLEGARVDEEAAVDRRGRAVGGLRGGQ